MPDWNEDYAIVCGGLIRTRLANQLRANFHAKRQRAVKHLVLAHIEDLRDFFSKPANERGPVIEAIIDGMQGIRAEPEKDKPFNRVRKDAYAKFIQPVMTELAAELLLEEIIKFSTDAYKKTFNTLSLEEQIQVIERFQHASFGDKTLLGNMNLMSYELDRVVDKLVENRFKQIYEQEKKKLLGEGESLHACEIDRQDNIIGQLREAVLARVQSRSADVEFDKALADDLDSHYQLPQGSERIARDIAAGVKAEKYQDLPYHEPNFSYHLVKALELGLITKEDFLDVKQLHEAMQSFHSGDTPRERSGKALIRVMRSEAEVKQVWDACDVKAVDRATLDTFYKQPKRVMFAVELNDQQAAALCYELLKVTSYEKQSSLSTLQVRLLQAFFERRVLPRLHEKSRPTVISEIKEMSKMTTRDDHRTQSNFYVKALKAAFPGISRISGEESFYSARADVKEVPVEVRNYATGGLIKAILKAGSGSPICCASVTPDGSLSIVIPQATTFNTLMDICRGTDAVHVAPQVGLQGVRTQRAFQELQDAQGLALQPEMKSSADEILRHLYPEALFLSGQVRPIETHLDREVLHKTHAWHCFPIARTHHDLFHAWVESFTQKTLLRRLAHLHDTRPLQITEALLSKGMEQITDAEFKDPFYYYSIEMSPYTSADTLTSASIEIAQAVFYQAGYNASESLCAPVQLLDDMLTQPGLWQDALLGKTPNEFYDESVILSIAKERAGAKDTVEEKLLHQVYKEIKSGHYAKALSAIERIPHRLNNFNRPNFIPNYLKMMVNYKRLTLAKERHPGLTGFDYYVLDALGGFANDQMDIFPEVKMLQGQMKEIGYQHFFYWSSNNGLYIHHDLRKACEISHYKAVMAPRVMRQAYTTAEKHKNSPYRLDNFPPNVLRGIVKDRLLPAVRGKAVKANELLAMVKSRIVDPFSKQILTAVISAVPTLDFSSLSMEGMIDRSDPEVAKCIVDFVFAHAYANQIDLIKQAVFNELLGIARPKGEISQRDWMNIGKSPTALQHLTEEATCRAAYMQGLHRSLEYSKKTGQFVFVKPEKAPSRADDAEKVEAGKTAAPSDDEEVSVKDVTLKSRSHVVMVDFSSPEGCSRESILDGVVDELNRRMQPIDIIRFIDSAGPSLRECNQRCIAEKIAIDSAELTQLVKGNIAILTKHCETLPPSLKGINTNFQMINAAFLAVYQSLTQPVPRKFDINELKQGFIAQIEHIVSRCDLSAFEGAEYLIKQAVDKSAHFMQQGTSVRDNRPSKLKMAFWDSKAAGKAPAKIETNPLRDKLYRLLDGKKAELSASPQGPHRK